MALYKRLETDFQFSDERGKLVQVAHTGYTQINILESKKGAARGGHYHKISSEAFFVINGCVEVTFRRNNEQETVRFQKGDFFLVSPSVTHSMFFDDDCLLLALYDIPIEKNDGLKDIYVDEVETGQANVD